MKNTIAHLALAVFLLLAAPLAYATPPVATPPPPAKPHMKARVVLSKEKTRAKIAAARVPRFPSVSLREINLKEDLAYRPFDDRGRPRAGATKELERFLRDTHTGRRHPVNPRLGKVLYEVARHYGRPIEVFSGYRPPEFSSKKHSRHLTGSAVDLRVPGVRNETLIAYLRAKFHPVGVGYYPNGAHVHLDVERNADTYWVDTGDAPSPTPTDLGADEATVDETVTNPPAPELFDPAFPGGIIVPVGPDDDPGFAE